MGLHGTIACPRRGLKTALTFDRLRSGDAFRDLGLDQDRFNPEEDRVMICGSMAMIKETAALLEEQGLVEGSNAEPGDFVIERAFVG